MTTLDTANTIREQLGQKSLTMLGATNLSGDDNSLSFKIGGCKTVTHIKIALEATDLYTVIFYYIRGVRVWRMVATVEGVSVDQLHATIEDQTGLRTSL